MEPLLTSKEGVFQFENHRSTGLKNWFLLYQCVAKTLLIFKKENSNFESLLNSDEMTLLHSERLSQPDDLIITVLVYVDWKKKKRFVSVLRITQILSLDPKTKKERKRKETQILENTYPILAMNLTSESQPHVLDCFGLCMLLFSLSWLTDSFIWLTLSAVLAAHCRKYFVLRFFLNTG